MRKWRGEKEAGTPSPQKESQGATASAPKIPEPESFVKGDGFEAWLEHWPLGPIVIVKSRCFHVGIAILDEERARELQKVLGPVIEALASA